MGKTIDLGNGYEGQIKELGGTDTSHIGQYEWRLSTVGSNTPKGLQMVGTAVASGVAVSENEAMTQIRAKLDELSAQEGFEGKDTEPLEPEPAEEAEDLSVLTVADLTDRAREMGLHGYSGLSKAELIALIEKGAPADEDE